MKDLSCALLAAVLSIFLFGCGGATIAPTAQSGSLASSAGGSSSSGQSSTGATTGTVIANIQAVAEDWRSWGQAAPNYVDCSAPCSESSWEEVYGVADPSLSGNATMFDLDPNMPYADALFSAGLIGQNAPHLRDYSHTLLPALHNFIYDTYFYVVKPEVTQSLEFDVAMDMNGADLTFGHQCNYLGDGQWDIWDNANSHWVSTGNPCKFVTGWNHLTIQVQREADNSLLYQSITLNGTVYTLNKAYPAGPAPASWYGLNVNFQMDGNSKGAPNTAYLDDLSFTYW
jgi:hypothetical protein